MDRKFIVAYALIIATLALIVVVKAASRGDQAHPETPPQPSSRNARPLSAIILPSVAHRGSDERLTELRDCTERLRVQLDSLQTKRLSSSPEQDLIEVDLDALCRSSDLIHNSLANPNVAKSKLSETLVLSEDEEAALAELISNFRSRLHRLEREASVELEEPRESGRTRRGEFILEIPAGIEGRSEYFDEFDQELSELLGTARGRAAFTWLSYNTAIGDRDSTKEYSFIKSSDGSIEVSTHLRVLVAHGTITPQAGAPGVSTSRQSHSSVTLQPDEAEAIFGHLIDLSSLTAVE